MNYTNRTKGKAYIIEKTSIQTILGVSKIYDSGGVDIVTDRHENSNVAPSGIQWSHNLWPDHVIMTYAHDLISIWQDKINGGLFATAR